MAKIEVTMPKMGESITEGTVISWHKEPGDAVEMDEILLEIGTDKVDTDVPSPAEGVLSEILVEEGATVDVGTTIAYIETEVDAGDADSSDDAPSSDGDREATDDGSGEGTKATPAAVEDSSSEADEGADASDTAADAASADASGDASGDAAGDSAGDASDDGSGASAGENVEPHLDVKPTDGGRVEVVMPKMGESITEGTVLTWHKQPGDEVDLDETLLEIGTDKVDTDVPSPSAGVLSEILVGENETVDVGTPLAIIATGEAKAREEKPQQPDESSEDSTPSGDGQAGTGGGTGGVSGAADDGAGSDAVGGIPRKGSDGRFFSPLVRSIAEKEGLSVDELESIEGSGRDGRVTKEDVIGHLEDRTETATKAKSDTKSDTTTKEESKPSRAQGKKPASPKPVAQALSGGDMYDGRVEVVKMDRMRQIIAEHMVRSKATSAHVTSFAEADVTNLVKFREATKEQFQDREGVKLTYTPFFVHAAVDALREYPILNASVVEDEIVIKKDLHIGIAVAIANAGLVAPVIRSAGQKSVAGLAHVAADLAERARSKQLQPDELQGGTFTITNIGSLGSLMGTPIINQPQVGILAVGAIKKRPVVIEDPNLGDIIAVRHMVYLSLSYDHRIIDGAVGSAFLQRFASALESVDADFEL